MPPFTETAGKIPLVLLHKAPLPAIDKEMLEAVGLQDKKQNILPGEEQPDGWVAFRCEASVKVDRDQAVFAGPWVHGSPQARFLYISWKRKSDEGSPWIQRIKIPLKVQDALVREAITTGKAMCADVTGRRPHDTAQVTWRLND